MGEADRSRVAVRRRLVGHSRHARGHIAGLTYLLPVFGDVSLRIDAGYGLSRDRAPPPAGPGVNRGVAGRRHWNVGRSGMLATPGGGSPQRAAGIRFVANEIGADRTAHQLCSNATHESRVT